MRLEGEGGSSDAVDTKARLMRGGRVRIVATNILPMTSIYKNG